jgi:hypothetical protein
MPFLLEDLSLYPLQEHEFGALIGDPEMILTWLTCCTRLSGCGWATHAAWHVTGRLTCLADSLAQQTHVSKRLFSDRLTYPADLRLGNSRSLARDWQTQLPGRLTCLADSFAKQTHVSSRLTFPTDSLIQLTCGWATHAAWHETGRLTCLAYSLFRQTHLSSRLTCVRSQQTIFL